MWKRLTSQTMTIWKLAFWAKTCHSHNDSYLLLIQCWKAKLKIKVNNLILELGPTQIENHDPITNNIIEIRKLKAKIMLLTWTFASVLIVKHCEFAKIKAHKKSDKNLLFQIGEWEQNCITLYLWLQNTYHQHPRPGLLHIEK